MAFLCSVTRLLFTTLLLSFSFSVSYSSDTMNMNESIRESHNESLVSATKKFELGFFTPEGSSDKRRYLGIWYYNITPKTVVWVANRDKPLLNTNGVFVVSGDGELKLMDENNETKWSASGGPSAMRKVTLMDSGNLVLSEVVLDRQSNESEGAQWQSFQNPTDTFLPGMNMKMTTADMKLISWKSPVDPAPGNFTFQVDPERENQYIIQKGALKKPHWKSQISENLFSFDEISPIASFLLSNFSIPYSNKECPYVGAKKGIFSKKTDYKNTRVLVSFNGQIKFLQWDNFASNWSVVRLEPSDPCHVFDACGEFGICNSDNAILCKCLPGFQPKSQTRWDDGDYTDGCERRADQLCSEAQNVKTGNFLKLKKIKVGKHGSPVELEDGGKCRDNCLSDCHCDAYLYANDTYRTPTCWTWTDGLDSVQEYTVDGRDLNVRVPLPDIEPLKRRCDTCGANIIPYPLSTSRDCGDPSYYNFKCDASNGQVYFVAPGGTFRVTNISREQRKFSIRMVEGYNCTNEDETGKFLQLNQSFPYNVSRGCSSKQSNLTSDIWLVDDRRPIELEIRWNQPLRPACQTSDNCTDWQNSFCSNVTEDGVRRCTCKKLFHWNSENLTCTSDEEIGNSVQSKGSVPNRLYIVVLGIIGTALVISCTTCSVYYFRRKSVANVQENRRSTERNQLAHLYDSERNVVDFIRSGQFREEEKKSIEVPFVVLESILAATDYFSESNKLGEGGFGPVYKGKFPGGPEIAIKRLSSGSGQGLDQFKNEVMLIAKLQHRNLVRLLGYCIEGEEKMLLYEYMPNKSLDLFIFDQTLCVLLNWEVRFNIILGIARGLVYLHHDSRLRIIHRDLKTSNVLLDKEMNPKISDFGLARIFGGNQTEASTARVVGTYGYMSPEYALDGFFSIKSDVFSFGVVVLEIISGKKNTGFYQLDQVLSLLGYAWKLWRENKALDFMDASLSESCNASEFLRCMNVGLLCVQEDPGDRPTMSNVVIMLGSEAASLPNPKQPAFIVRKSHSSTGSSSKALSINEITATIGQGR